MLRLTYVGHATVLIELDGIRFLTDPLLTRWLGPLRRQLKPVEAASLHDIDCVLLSHLHHDHLHLPSLALLDRSTQLVVPSGAGGLLRARGFRDIREVRPGERFSIGSVEVDVVRAVHDPARHLSTVTAEPQGFLLRGSQTVYFAGDTDLYPEMRDLHPAIDVALIPIWGWGPTLGPGHLDPVRAADAVGLLRPRIAIPIHWGTYFPAALPWRRRVTLREMPRAFSFRVSVVAPAVEVRVIDPGESTAVLPSDAT
jgi:L-ascorbate metabolism protein UlaG (beta-lactamase superfamily)